MTEWWNDEKTKTGMMEWCLPVGRQGMMEYFGKELTLTLTLG
jgi:hypothetical protein